MTIPKISYIDRLSDYTVEKILLKEKLAPTSTLPEKIEALKPEQLKIFVEKVIGSLTKEKKALDAIERFANILSTVKLEDATREKFPKLVSAIDTAEKMRTQAKQYLEIVNTRPPTTALKIKLGQAADFLLSVFEGLLNTLGLADLFDTSESPQAKANKILALGALISSVGAVLIPTIGLIPGFFVIVIVAILLVGLGHVYPKIRPMPTHIPGMDNWTKQYGEGDLHVSSQRAKEIERVVSALTPGEPVLLTGPSGVGKTELIKSLVRDVAQKKYLELQGKHFFYASAINLSAEKLEIIKRNMGRHKDNIIVVIDGLTADSALLSKLRDFPYLIGITENPEGVQFGTQIAIQGTTAEQTLAIIQAAALKHPNVLIQQGVLNKIVDASGPHQPKDALKLFNSCVHRTMRSQMSDLEKRVDECRNKILAAATQNMEGSNLPYEKQELHSLQDQLTTLEKQLKGEREKRAQFFFLREKLPKIKTAISRTTQHLNAKSSKRDQNIFLLLSHYFQPAFEKMLKDEASRLGLETEISEGQISSVLVN